MRSSSILTRISKYKDNKKGATKAVFSSRAYASLLSEVLDEVRTETGGVLLGYWENGCWEVVESIDPGPSSLFETAYFEYDQDYVNHLINKVSKIYGRQLDLIGLWHRHPGSLDRFSSTDDETNAKYAALSEHGAISALVNIDPHFRLTVYQVNKNPFSYEKIPYTVLDRNSDRDQAPYADITKRVRTIESAVAHGITIVNEGTTASSASASEVREALKTYLLKRATDKMQNESIGTTDSWSDDDYVLLLAAIEQDAEELEKLGIGLTLQPDESGQIALMAVDSTGESIAVVDGFKPKDDGRILFSFNGQSYFYAPRIIANAFKEHSL